MYISPNHPDPPRRPEPPPDDGRRLGAVSRGDGRDELRVTLKTFAGRPFVSLRVWSRDDDGAWWPVKGKGVSVRLGEIAGVIDALRRADAAAGELDRRRQPPRPAPRESRQGVAGPGGGDRAGGSAGTRGGAAGGPGRQPDRAGWREVRLPEPGGSAGFSELDEFDRTK